MVMNARGILTSRETEIAALTARGLSEKEIAHMLVISPNTVRVHIENIKRQLGARNKTHAIAMLLSAEVICLERSDTAHARARCAI
jgi:DNA-binding CsgD family transcriptional regulator